MEVGVPESKDVTHSPVCREVRIISGVSILNFSALRNLLRWLKFSIGLHMLFGFGTKNSWLSNPRFDFRPTLSIFVCQLIQCLQQVEVPVRMYIAPDDCRWPCQAWSGLEREGVALLQQLYYLRSGPQGFLSFPKLI